MKRGAPDSDRHKRKVASRSISRSEETSYPLPSLSEDNPPLCNVIVFPLTPVYQSNGNDSIFSLFQYPPASDSYLPPSLYTPNDCSITHPSQLPTPTQIEELLKQPSNLQHGLEILISKWKPDIAFDLLQIAKQFLSDHAAQLDIWRPCSSGLSIFGEMVFHKPRMSYNDIESLTRWSLEADIKSKHNSEDFGSSSPEGIQWRKAYHALSWRDAMHAIGIMKTDLWSGGCFRNAAITIIANRHLDTLQHSLERHLESISSSNVNTEFLTESEDYLKILKQLADSAMNIKPSWYLLSLKLHNCSSFHEFVDRELLEGRLETTERHKGKHLELETSSSGDSQISEDTCK